MPARLLFGGEAELRCTDCGGPITAVGPGAAEGADFADLVEAFALHPCTRRSEFPHELTHPDGRPCRDYTCCRP